MPYGTRRACAPLWEQLQPAFEADEAPELLTQVGLSREVALHYPFDERSGEHLAVAGLGREQQVAHVVTQVAAKPSAEGDAEPHLSAASDFGWHEVGEGVPQNRFRPSPIQLESIRQCRDVLDEFTI